MARPFAERIRALKKLKSVPRIEAKLIEIEHEMMASIVDGLLDRDVLLAEIARALGDTSKLNEKTRARTEEANLRRSVRERFGLPRLTLFR